VAQQAKSWLQPSLPPPTTTLEGHRIVEWVREIQDVVTRALNHPNELRLEVMYTAPTKVRVGMVVYADGVKWNPGAGEGLYVWKSDSAWHKAA